MTTKDADRIIACGEQLLDRLDQCDICPQECGADRKAGETGQCGADQRLKIAAVNLHFGEEPPLSGTRGSGTIFLSGCSLACLYCQNYPISQQMVGTYFTIDQLVDKMFALAAKGAHNINFVTPDHFFGHIACAIGQAIKKGLKIPIVCNCSGWEKPETLRILEGVFDIYLADMRYNNDSLARNYSGASRYKELNRAAIKEMHRQVGALKIDAEGIAVRGLLVRHLVLPDGISGSKEIFKFLAEEVSVETYVSLMSQYFPAYQAPDHPQLSRRITPVEFDKAVEMFYNAGLKNGYIQEMD